MTRIKKKLEDKQDIRLLIDHFYEKVRRDDIIGFIFNDIANVDWAQHLPVMYSFWENVLFATGGYKGNPMLVHLQLNQLSRLSGTHFARWKQLFIETIDEHFEGDMAERARQRATSIATMLELKISAANSQ